MGPLWKAMGDLMPETPKPKEVPYQWKWASIRPLVYESAKIVSVDEAVRRVLMLLNPGLPRDQAAATQTLYAGIQIILPGEVARAHRHTPNALRFVMEGEGAFTTVGGEKTILRHGDVVTTPNWTWHDHGNGSRGPVVWLDALDIPVVNAVSGMFYEDFSGKAQGVEDPVNSSRETYGRGLRPVAEERSTAYSPILNYAYESARKALRAMPAGSRSRTDGRILEYINPLTGGPILPTMDAFLQEIPSHSTLKAHRQSSSKVIMGVEGSGILEVEGERFEWEPYDVMVVPTWAKHRHVNPGDKPAVLFSYTNAPVMKALSLLREWEE
jgi:gentisate 1,2-dioxygenase